MHGAQHILLAVFLVLVLAAATRRLSQVIPLPYTALLLLTGLGLGAAAKTAQIQQLAPGLAEALTGLAAIDPHLLLFLFLPPLLFESAFALDPHVFRRSVGQIVLLAVPGLLLATFGIAALMKGILTPSWDWPTALMFGALLGATDPVAVVAILRETGAGGRLGAIVEGESLLNDGTAIVTFSVFFALATGQADFSGAAVTASFARVSLVGVLVGLVIGALAVHWIGTVVEDALVEITITITAAWLTWYVAEDLLHVSGVLATVALGLVFAWSGRQRISAAIDAFLHQFWEMMAYLANSLIFVLVGVLIAVRAPLGDPTAWLQLAGLYVGIHVVRGGANLLLYPALQRLGYGMTHAELALLSWGGLRGAVGLALALVVAGHDGLPQDVRDRVLFLTGGIVVLTLLINGSTTRLVLHWLGLDRIPEARRALLAQVANRLHDTAARELLVLRDDPWLRQADWQRVQRDNPAPERANEMAGTSGSSIQELRQRLVAVEKRAYWRQFEDGVVRPELLRGLLEASDALADSEVPLSDRRAFAPLLSTPRWLQTLSKRPRFARLAWPLVTRRLENQYEIARAVATAQEEVLRALEVLATDDDVQAELETEIQRARRDALDILESTAEGFAALAAAVQTRIALRSIATRLRHELEAIIREGVANESEIEPWRARIRRAMHVHLGRDARIRAIDPLSLIRQIPWLEGHGEAIVQRLAEAGQERVYAPGQEIFRQGDPGDHLVLLAHGLADVWITSPDQERIHVARLDPGNILGEMALITGEPRTATVTAHTPVTVLAVPFAAIQPILDDKPELAERLLWLTAVRLAENLLATRPPWTDWNRSGLRRWLLMGRIEPVKAGQRVELTRPAVLVTGRMQAGNESPEVAPALLTPGAWVANERSHLFHLPQQ
ncbi:MAG: hypothetical protein D6761_01485 [Candidatus Dadabacteria bacterium]|nr:MAG: hypothetical protein D6761_01485 [Candidatus Dadabacteria bacterium]